MRRDIKCWKGIKRFLAFAVMRKNLKIVFSDNQSYISTLGSIMFMGAIMLYFTKYQLIVEQVGVLHANVEVVLQIIMALMFGINIAILDYRLHYTKGVKANATGSAAIGSLIGLILAGCPSSSSSLASLIGITPFLSILPLNGLEVKVLGLLLLIYSTISLLNRRFKRAIPRNLDLSKKHLEW